MSLHFSSGTANRLIRKKKTWWQPFRSIKQWLYIFKLTGILTLGYWYFVFGCRALWSDAKAGKSVCDRTVCTLIHTVCKFTVLLWVNFVPLYSLIGAEEEQMKVAESPLRTGEKQERRNMDRNHGRVGLRSGGGSSSKMAPGATVRLGRWWRKSHWPRWHHIMSHCFLVSHTRLLSDRPNLLPEPSHTHRHVWRILQKKVKQKHKNATVYVFKRGKHISSHQS